jgi:signal transduction histidine kinase
MQAPSASPTRSEPDRPPRSVLRGVDPWRLAATLVVALALAAGSIDMVTGDGRGHVGFLAAVLVLGLAGLVAALRDNALAAVVATLLVAAEVRDPAPAGTWAVAGGLLFLVALRRERLDAVVAGTVFAATSILADSPWAEEWVDGGVFGFFTLAAAMVGVGQWVQAQRKYVVAEVGRRREELERRRVEVARSLAEERLRIARDLHDSVAHHIAVVSVQTNLARAQLAVSPEAADLALQSVQTAARDVLAELQQVLGVLRDEPDAAGVTATQDRRPDRLDDLVATYREIGLDTRPTGLELFPVLPPVHHAAVYRILQEALTNAHRHGDGRATLVLERDDDGGWLTLTVRNLAGATAAGASGGGGHGGGGHGLIGMQERALALGGSMDAGPEGPEFVVRVRVPVALVADGGGVQR